MSVIKLGCDPESFIVNTKSGDYVPAFGIVPGDKQNPFALDGGAVQVDGLACEFNIDPVTNAEDFDKNITKVISQIDEMIKDVDKDFALAWNPIAEFRQDVWDLSPEQQKMLGCDPDYNIAGEVNVNPTEKLEGSRLRTAAGHLHIGWRGDNLVDDVFESGHFNLCLQIARGFDTVSKKLEGFAPVSADEVRRLDFYGHSGSWRPKRYGVELRAPSNVWVRTSSTRKAIFEATRGRFNELTGL